MGASCSHSRALVNQLDQDKSPGIILTEEYGMSHCPDCGKYQRVSRKVGSVTGLEWTSWKPVDSKTCKHDFDAPETYEIGRETSATGTLLRFLGPSLDGIQYHSFMIATAHCKRCGIDFKVRAEYRDEYRDEGKRSVQVRTTDWKPIYDEVPVQRKEYKKVLRVVD